MMRPRYVKQNQVLAEEGKWRCGHCSEIKSLDEYSVDTYHWTGRRTICKKCDVKLDDNEYRASIGLEPMARAPRSAEDNHRHYENQKAKYGMEAIREYSRKAYRKNREKILAYHRERYHSKREALNDCSAGEQ